MRNYFSPEAKGKLHDMFTEVFSKPQMFPPDVNQFAFEMVERMDSFMLTLNEQKSYSDIIFQDGEMGKKCNLGYFHVFPRKMFRQQHIKALRTLVEHYEQTGVGLTTAELSEICSPLKGEHTQSSVAHFPEMRFWGFVDSAGEKMRNEAWIPHLAYCHSFLNNEVPVPLFVYTCKDVETGKTIIFPRQEWPNDAERPEVKFCSEMEYVSQDDAQEHVENALADTRAQQ